MTQNQGLSPLKQYVGGYLVLGIGVPQYLQRVV